MDKFIKMEIFELEEDETNNITYLSKLGDSYLDLSNPANKSMYQFIEKNYTKKNSLYFNSERSEVLRLVPIDSMPSGFKADVKNEPEN